jgi:hypothetical protein
LRKAANSRWYYLADNETRREQSFECWDKEKSRKVSNLLGVQDS